jgi:ferredoxin-NADP reductase
MRVRLKDRRLEAAEVMSFVFDLAGQTYEYLPGQYAVYELDELSFPDDRGKKRHFTISSSPSEKGIIMFTTRLRGSGFKETLRHAPLGYELTVSSARGSFVLPAGEARRHVFIAGGIGITPYRSILRYAADTQTPLQVRMLYFNRLPSHIVFGRELEEIARRIPTFSLVCVVDGPDEDWKGERGELSESMIRRYVPELDQALFWLSGPPQAVGAFRKVLEQTGIREEAIRLENFMGY